MQNGFNYKEKKREPDGSGKTFKTDLLKRYESRNAIEQ